MPVKLKNFANKKHKTHPLPISLVGWSCGAWLLCLLAERYPNVANKLVLVGSGLFDAQYAESIKRKRLSGQNDKERIEYQSVLADLSGQTDTSTLMKLFDKTDGFATDATPHPPVRIDPSSHEAVWKDAAETRSSGELLRRISKIRCPITAIHGRYDPHPVEGLSGPLNDRLSLFELIVIEKCCHKPWRKFHAKKSFFDAQQRSIETAQS